MALELVVVTPEGEVFADQVEQVVLPGEAGEFGVLESHERFLTPLQPGPVEIRQAAGNQWAAITSGFAEVDGSRVVVLVDSCALASGIDKSEVEARRGEADRALSLLEVDDETAHERARLSAIIAQADLELDVAGR